MKRLKRHRCAIYTRKSTTEGLEQDFNSLDAQRASCEAYIQSQTHERWTLIPALYDDGGFSGGSMERPALKVLTDDIEKSRIDIVVVYKVDRLTRSLTDFARLVELFDAKQVSFVSVTQAFNTTTSMGRLTLNVLLSFAQFEREVTAERIRDKFKASKEKGMWMGGRPPLGYDIKERHLIINAKEADRVEHIFERYLALGSVSKLELELEQQNICSKYWITQAGKKTGGNPFSRGALYSLLKNPIYIGKISHKELIHEGLHDGIIPQPLWDQVQNLLATNRAERANATNAKSPSLLTGMLEDIYGNRFKPSHCKKQNRRYHYYIGGDLTLPAYEIETLVVRELAAFLENQSAIVRLFQNDKATDLEAMLAMANITARQMKSNPGRAMLKSLLNKIVVSSDQLDIHVNLPDLREMICNDAPERSNVKTVGGKDTHIIALGIHLKRTSHGKRIILGQSKNNQTAKVDPSLLKSIARAHIWFEDLKAGRSYTDIAMRENIDRRHVSRTIRLAFLAPDIVESIFNGVTPLNMSVDQLLKLPDFPVDWQDQRKMLQFI